ncbi:MAG: A/G-specific adenine glycosylase, partial [Mailhella sp.]|nr:A/G-specific adenine glycosylase [Mailhella sp.]
MAHFFSDDSAQQIALTLLQWFETHKRPLPWRVSYEPYEVWISEVMLQQTQMERGVTYFQRWMERFPTVADVAEAEEEEILRCWEGLGYYRRARLLHAAAKQMMELHGGKIPQTQSELSALPGLGAYTVDALLSIAFEKNVVPVDANVERVFSRLLDIDSPVKKKPASEIIRTEALRLLPEGKARNYAQALMEFGALICGKAPRCMQCPLRPHCQAHAHGVERERPVLETRISSVPVTSSHGILLCEKKALLFQRPASGLWGNMWEFPGVDDTQRPPREAILHVFDSLGIPCEVIAPLGTVQHGY